MFPGDTIPAGDDLSHFESAFRASLAAAVNSNGDIVLQAGDIDVESIVLGSLVTTFTVRVKDECRWRLGNGNMQAQIQIDDAESADDCADATRRQCPTATIANYGAAAYDRSCFCQFGTILLDDNSRRLSCLLPNQRREILAAYSRVTMIAVGNLESVELSPLIPVSAILGCTDVTAVNFDHAANQDDGSCISRVYGCTQSSAVNFCPACNAEDGSCIDKQVGCTDPRALNYCSFCNTDNAELTECVYPIQSPGAAPVNRVGVDVTVDLSASRAISPSQFLTRIASLLAQMEVSDTNISVIGYSQSVRAEIVIDPEGRQLRETDVVEPILQALARVYAVERRAIVEIHETEIQGTMDSSSDELRRLRVTGVKVLYSAHADRILDSVHAANNSSTEDFISKFVNEMNAANDIDLYLFEDDVDIVNGPYFTSDCSMKISASSPFVAQAVAHAAQSLPTEESITVARIVCRVGMAPFSNGANCDEVARAFDHGHLPCAELMLSAVSRGGNFISVFNPSNTSVMLSSGSTKYSIQHVQSDGSELSSKVLLGRHGTLERCIDVPNNPCITGVLPPFSTYTLCSGAAQARSCQHQFSQALSPDLVSVVVLRSEEETKPATNCSISGTFCGADASISRVGDSVECEDTLIDVFTHCPGDAIDQTLFRRSAVVTPSRSFSKREWVGDPQQSACRQSVDENSNSCQCVFPFIYNGRIFSDCTS
eukprot:SAG31_NODE_2_length_46263_cov_45.908043_21_plen_714_part_00